MTNNNIYFVANWKMFGDIKSLKSLNKVIKLSNSKKFKNNKILYCPPYTLLDKFVEKTKKTRINICAQDCHFDLSSDAYTGSISSKQIKNIGAKYVILGHSEKRNEGDKNEIINKKIKSAIKSKLKVILCIGESLIQKRKKKTLNVLKKQILTCLKNIKFSKNIFIAYEPVWSIGTGNTLSNDELVNIIRKIKQFCNKKFKKNIKVFYGGSVNPKNITNLKKIHFIDGFLVGSASRNSNKFIDIIKKSIN